MKLVIIIGIIIIGIIGTVAVFTSMPSDTWKDNRTGFIGVSSPDENKDKIDCLSRGGIWDNSCSIEKKNQEDENSDICLGKEQCLALQVTKIVDGDTIYADSYKIRLSLTNTPEKNEPGFYEATSFTAMSCPIGSRIIVDQDDLQPFDQYDRLLGKVYCENGILNEILLQNGHADISTQYCDSSEFSGESWAQTYGCGITKDTSVPKSSTTMEPTQSNCDPSYPDVCILPYPPDLNCGDIQYKKFKVLQPDPHGFDRDEDGIGCES